MSDSLRRQASSIGLLLVLALPTASMARVVLPVGPGSASPAASPTRQLPPELQTIKRKIQGGALDAGIAELEKLVTQQPSAPAYGLLGEAYLARRDPLKALEAFRKLSALAPKDPYGPYLAGLALRAQGKSAEARLEFEASLALAPGFTDALAFLVALDFADKNPDAALERVTRQITLVPRSGSLQHLLARVRETRGERDLAEAAYLKAIELEPRSVAPYLELAELRATSGRIAQAAATVRDAVNVHPKHLGALILLGTLAEKQGDIPAAQAAYEQALALSPSFAPAANNLAYLLVDHGGDQERALKLAQAARAAAPNDPNILDTLGWILYKRGAYRQALDLLRQSAEKLPQDAVVQYHLGMAAARAGDRDTARRALTLSVNAPASFPGKDEARKTLDGLR